MSKKLEMLTKKLTAEELEMKKKGFQDFLQAPSTKLLLSMVPETNPPELMSSLLEQTYYSAFGHGAGFTMLATVTLLRSFKEEDEE